MKRSLELGANLWNGGEFYGPPTANSLHLLNAYFKAHPEDVEKVVINIKGALDFAKMSPDGTDAGIRKSVDNCIQILGGTKKIDVFEMARVDPNVPIEESVGYLAKLIEEGKISAIALSEVRADTIRRAAKVHKIAGGVEIEFSLFATEPLTNGIFEACAENDIPVIAYSPLGRGLLVRAPTCCLALHLLTFIASRLVNLIPLTQDTATTHAPRATLLTTTCKGPTRSLPLQKRKDVHPDSSLSLGSNPLTVAQECRPSFPSLALPRRAGWRRI